MNLSLAKKLGAKYPGLMPTVRAAEVRLRSRLSGLNPSSPADCNRALMIYKDTVHEATAEYMANPERGALTIQTIIGAIIGVMLLVFFIVYMWQTGIPEVITATSNTTAITAAGATAGQLSFVTMAGGLLVFLLLAATIYMGVKAMGFGGGKGGGGGGKKRRR